MERYSVYEGFMKDLRKQVKKIERKCAKYGCEFHYEEVGEEFKTIKVDDVEHVLKYINIEVEGTARINGWEFVASVEHTNEGNIIRKAMTDAEIPARFRCSDPTCDHCKTNRIRKYTYIIRNADNGDYKQIGKACLKDYTNGMSAEWATFMASCKDVFEEASERYPSVGGYGFTYYISTKDFVRYCAETVKHFGYVKSGYADATRDRAYRYYKVCEDGNSIAPKIREHSIAEMENVGFDANSAEAIKTAEGALKWISEQDADNDYIHNLKVITSAEYVDANKLGFLASLIPAYNRATKAEEEKKAECTSEWAGKVGDKVIINVAEVKVLACWENTFSYYGGLTYLYKITDANGNVFTWKTNKDVEDDAKEIAGTIKDLDEYKGVKQTVLTRCKVTKIAEKQQPENDCKYEGSAQEGFDTFWNYVEGK